jgi:Anti-sigma-D factor RsdA to sigma factor binding region
MADRHESDGRESPESPQAGRSGELHPITSGAKSTERDDTHVSSENEYFSALDLDEPGDEPEDLAQIRSDDALLDALAAQYRAAENGAPSTNGHHSGNGHAPVDFDDEQLNALLLAWRQDVDSVPIPEMVDTTTAVATVTAARSARRRRPRLLVPVAAAAAALAIAFTGVGMAARDAQPGDALWGLSKVLYADHARSVEAAQSVRTDLDDAQQALQQGKIDEAKDALQAAGSALSAVSTEDGKDDLQAKHESLLEQLISTVPGTIPSSTTSAAERSETVKATSTPTSTTVATQPSSESPSQPPPTSNTSSSSVTPSSPSSPDPSEPDDPPVGNGGGGPPRSDEPSTEVTPNSSGAGETTAGT